EKTVVETNAFLIRYKCFHLMEKRKVFQWNIEIQGFDTGELSFKLAGIALETTLKNRVGFCIHHPIRETIGQPVEITQPDSSTYHGQFPEHIAPHDPFRNIASMRWRCAKNWYRLHFEGDIFETEDQRNWTDASFKTYCTPLDKPFPVMLEKGQEIIQSIRFVPEKPLSFIAKK